MNEELKFVKIEPPEPRRVYVFPDREIVIEDIVAVCVRASGNHRVETASGDKWIIASGWLAIRLSGVKDWTF